MAYAQYYLNLLIESSIIHTFALSSVEKLSYVLQSFLLLGDLYVNKNDI